MNYRDQDNFKHDRKGEHSSGPLFRISTWTRDVPLLIAIAVRDMAVSLTESSRLRKHRTQLDWNEVAAAKVRSDIAELLDKDRLAEVTDNSEYTTKHPNNQTSALDQKLIEEISLAVKRDGASNITRTKAYLSCYEAYPELHWSFLAHMVSRNAGWNMTDLRGARAADLLDEEAKQAAYRFLERSNALIFQDAYPQLLLYMKSRELGSSQFHLLPHFHVSRFMRPFWEQFWIDRGSVLLTVGLIINEQNYVEKRVIQHPYYQKYVTSRIHYHMNSLSGTNHVVFPLLQGTDRQGGPEEHEADRLAGRVVSDFDLLASRIALGKSLYAMLMGLGAVRSGAERFAARVPHTGSRADYWPDLFTANSEEALTAPVQGSELLRGETLPPGQRLYSPKLASAWGDTAHEPIQHQDWLMGKGALAAISAPKPPYLCDITRRHRLGILTTALAHDIMSK